MYKFLAPPTAKPRLRNVAPVPSGGTGANDAIEAAVNLGAISFEYLDTPLYASKLNGQTVVSASQMPSYSVNQPTVQGLTELYTTQVSNYTITNFDCNKQYSLSISAGTIVRTKEIVTITAPSEVQTLTVTINNKLFNIQVKDPWPLAPTIGGNTSGSSTNAYLFLSSSVFSVISGSSTHQSTDWQVSTVTDFSTIAAQSLDDTVNLRSISFLTLSLNTTYYVRARYKSSLGVLGDWSATLTIVTRNKYTPTAEEAKLVAGDRLANDIAGRSVAIDSTGTRVAVGSPEADISGTVNCGAVYIFVRNGTTWTQEQKITPLSRGTNHFAGFSVDMDSSGERAFVSAYGFSSMRGTVWVFRRTGTSWSQEAQISASDAASNDQFGFSVACNSDGTYLLVGSNRDTPTSLPRCGSAYIFTRSGTTWTQQAKIVPTSGLADDNFGFSVDINSDGSRAIIGASLADPPTGFTSAGYAYIFTRSGTTWSQEARLQATPTLAGSQFGTCVCINNTATTVVIGAPFHTLTTATSCGVVYVFTRSGTTWTQSAIISAFDRASNDNFGISISINLDGTRLLVGAHNSDPEAISNAGAAYIFNLVNSNWIQDFKYTASDRQASDNYGWAVNMSSDATRIIIGSPREDPSNVSNAGSCYIYV